MEKWGQEKPSTDYGRESFNFSFHDVFRDNGHDDAFYHDVIHESCNNKSLARSVLAGLGGEDFHGDGGPGDMNGFDVNF